MDVYAELIAQIGISKDEHASKYAIKRLWELLKEEDGSASHLCKVCPTQSELFKLWDLGVTKNAPPNYVESFCNIFRALLHEDGVGLAERLLHPKRVRVIHSLLSSGNRTKISCGLLLLNDIAQGGSSNVSLILKNIDFSLNALKIVGIPPKVAGGTIMNAAIFGEDGEYAYKLWKSGELSKMPTRAAYLEFFKSMLIQCSTMKIPEILAIKHFSNSALNYLSKDPYYVQEALLKVVQKYVMDQNLYVITPSTKAMAMSERFVSQLAQTIQQASEVLHGNEDISSHVGNVINQASDILIQLLSCPDHGIVPYKNIECFFSKHLDHYHSEKVKSLLHSLKPATCKEHAQILREIFSKNPIISIFYLTKCSIDFDSKKVTSNLVHMSIVIVAFDAFIAHIRQLGSDCPFNQDMVLSNWKRVTTGQIVSKTGLSKSVQHSMVLISHTTVVYLSRLLETLSVILELAHSHFDVNDFEIFRDKISKYSKEYLPDLQIIIAYHTKIKNDHSRRNTHRSRKLTGILRLLRLWIDLFPEVVLESNIVIESIIPSDIGCVHVENQREYIETLQQVSSSPKAMALNPVVGAMFKLSIDKRKFTKVYNMRYEWILKQMNSTYLFYDGAASARIWASNAIKYQSAFIIDFFIDCIKTTMKKPTTYLDLIHSCDFSYLDIKDFGPVKITPLLSCALEKMCRVMKSKSRSSGDKIQVTAFMQNILVDYCSNSMQPFHVFLVFKHIIDIEFPADNHEKNISKRRRADGRLSCSQVLEYCNSEDYEAFRWIFDLHENVSELTVLQANKRKYKDNDQSIKMSQHSNLWTVLYNKDNILIQNEHVQFWTSEACTDIGNLVELLETDPISSITSMQFQMLFGDTRMTLPKMNTFISAFELFVSKSLKNAQLGFDVFSGSDSSFFWRHIRQRLDKNLDLSIQIYQIIKTFQNKDILGEDKLFEQVHGNSSGLAQDLIALMEKNEGIILAQVIIQSSSKIYSLQVDDLKHLMSLSSFDAHGISEFEGHMTDIICKLVALNLDRYCHENRLEIFHFIEKNISDQFSEELFDKRCLFFVKVYCKLHSMLKDQLSEDHSPPRLLIDRLFSHFWLPEVPDYLVELFSLKISENMINLLIGSLEVAKAQKSKYKRRVMLASIAPVLDKCLSHQLEPNLLNRLRDTFMEPLFQYYTSKRIDCQTDPRDRKVFDRLHQHVGSILPSFINLATVQYVMISVQTLLKLKPEDDLKSANQPHNPSVGHKLDLLETIVGCITKEMVCHTELGCSAFICQLSTFAMNYFHSMVDMEKTLPSSSSLINLIHKLGDAVAIFNENDRASEHFFKMLQVWAEKFVPCILKTSRRSLEGSKSIRRFTASIIPEDTESKMLNLDDEHITEIFGKVSSLFLEIFTADIILEILKDNGLPHITSNEYFRTKLPLESIVACVRGGTMTWNSLRETQENNTNHKIELCEILESILDIITLLEGLLPSDATQGFKESFEKAETAMLRFLLASYDASLSRTDMATWSLIKLLNWRIWRRRSQRDSIQRHDDYDIITAIFEGPISKMQFPWGKAALSTGKSHAFEIYPLRCAMTVVDFPEWRHLLYEDRLPDDITMDQISPEHFMSYEPSGYDPSFIIPACLSLLQSGAITADFLVESMALSVIIRCLASDDIFLRAISYECLSLLDQNTSSMFVEGSRDVQRLRLVLDWLKASITLQFQQLRRIHALLAAEILVVIFRPESPMFSLLSKYLTNSAFLDHTRLPFLKAGFSFRGTDERMWFQKLLISGIRSAEDIFLYYKAHIFEVVMNLASSTHNNDSELAVLLIQKAASIPKGSRVMSQSCSLMSWLALTMNYMVNGGDEESKKHSIALLHDTWTLMSLWRGTLHRGSDRDRTNAARELRIAKMRLTTQCEHHMNHST